MDAGQHEYVARLDYGFGDGDVQGADHRAETRRHMLKMPVVQNLSLPDVDAVGGYGQAAPPEPTKGN